MRQKERAVDDTNPILNWVRDDNRDIILTGGAVRAGKLLRLQAEWHPWGSYTGPDRFTIRTARTRFGYGRKVGDIVADVDGPPRTHSLSAWQAGLRNPTHQRRYYFTDLHKNRSGELTVSDVDFFTSAPSVQAEAGLTVALPFSPAGRLAVRGGRATARYHVGATTDPQVKVTLMTTSGDGSSNDLIPYLRQPRVLSPSRDRDLLFLPDRVRWHPVLAGGQRELILDVDERHFAEVSVVPEHDYADSRVPFMTGFALRVENLADPSQFVISEIVTVQGGSQFRQFVRLPYPEGGVLFRF
jgi:hypothetical protein